MPNSPTDLAAVWPKELRRVFGWPNLSLTPSKGHLGMSVFNEYVDMRVVDIYCRDGHKLAEKWLSIGVPHFLNMQGHDVLAKIKNKVPSKRALAYAEHHLKSFRLKLLHREFDVNSVLKTP